MSRYALYGLESHAHGTFPGSLSKSKRSDSWEDVRPHTEQVEAYMPWYHRQLHHMIIHSGISSCSLFSGCISQSPPVLRLPNRSRRNLDPLSWLIDPQICTGVSSTKYSMGTRVRHLFCHLCIPTRALVSDSTILPPDLHRDLLKRPYEETMDGR